MVRKTIKHSLLSSTLPALLALGATAQAEPTGQVSSKEQMNNIFQSFSALQGYMGISGEFARKENHQKIATLLKSLADNFHKLDGIAGDKRFAQEGIEETLKQTGETLSDISKSFTAGNSDYALWRLRHVTSYCITCHTRFEIKSDFATPETSSLAKLSPLERGNYYFATRQFKQAADIYLNIAQDPAATFERMDAMRRWLVIEIRVHPDPKEALTTLRGILSSSKLPPYEQSEFKNWIESLDRWLQEPAVTITTAEQAITQTRRLIAAAGESGSWLTDSGSFVEMLRASSTLHQYYPLLSKSEYYAETLYLLGAIYSRMPRLFQVELPEVYLEQCIRQFPGTKDAQRSYRVIEELVLNDFTGSSGTHLPDEDRLRLEHLKQLAYGRDVAGGLRTDL